MTKRAVLHIGTGKTGTSSIQASLAHGRDALVGANYPYTHPAADAWGYGPHNAQHFLPMIYRPLARLPRLYIRNYSDDEALRQHAEYLRQVFFDAIGDSDRLIISCEYLAGFNSNEIAHLKRDLDALGFHDVRVIVYVRAPASLYLSLVQQHMKASHLVTNPARYRYRFRQAIEDYSDAFEGNISVAKFARESLHQNCVVQDFLKRAEDYLGLKFSPVKTQIRNESLTCEALFVLQRYRELFHSEEHNISTKSSNWLVSLLTKEGGQVTHHPLTLKKEAADLINANHLDDLHWLKTHFNVDFEVSGGPPTGKNQAKYVALADVVEEPNPQYRDELLFVLLRHLLQGRKR